MRDQPTIVGDDMGDDRSDPLGRSRARTGRAVGRCFGAHAGLNLRRSRIEKACIPNIRDTQNSRMIAATRKHNGEYDEERKTAISPKYLMSLIKFRFFGGDEFRQRYIRNASATSSNP